VPWEEARTQYSGRQAIFVRIPDAIDGIKRMRRDRERRHLKLDSAWDTIRRWLERLAEPIDGSSGATDEPQVSTSGRSPTSRR
jgi:hypothetical protein